MPCEACNAQFTVFKRKKSCTECRRLYCNQCLVKRKERVLCERCVVFTKRPLSKVELLKLKPKDLIFFLQSKHISTTGCVEKEELVNLVLIHVNNSTSYGGTADGHAGGVNNETDENGSNPFDQIKQTCQNLFTSFTDKLASDLNFDVKTSTTAQSQNIFSQPRASSRPAAPNGSQHSSSFSSHTSFVSPQQSTQHSPTTPPPTTQASAQEPSNVSSTHSQNAAPTNYRHSSSNASSAGPTSPVFSVASSSSAADTSSIGGDGTTRRFTASSTHRNARSPTSVLPTVHQSTTTSTVPVGAQQNAKARPSSLAHRNFADLDGSGSGCDCSDDEMINTFHREYSKTTTPTSPEVKVLINDGPHEAGPSEPLPKIPIPKTPIIPTAKESVDSGSDASSFEELGATGVAGGTAIGTSTDTDTSWQFVSKSTLADSPPPQSATPSPLPVGIDVTAAPVPELPSFTAGRSPFNVSNSTFHPQHSNESVSLLHAARRLTRRRSDTAVYQSSSVSVASRRSYNRPDYECGGGSGAGGGVDDEDYDDDYGIGGGGGGRRPDMSRKRTKTSCDKCGKNKGNLRRHVAKFKRQLETTKATEVEIKQQLDAFLVYLESCNRNSIDCSDSEGAGGSVEGDSRNDVTFRINENFTDEIGIDVDDDYEDDRFIFGDDEGIHVYGTDDTSGGSCGPPRHFINLTDYPDSSDLDELNVKQLKEILMLNRVDFKGCCEKTELLDRVKRLWNEYNSCPAIDKLPSDDLCKICMDAPIECVILECGHMATCTSCGKVLSECPICRQYIVRVVRFFRA